MESYIEARVREITEASHARAAADAVIAHRLAALEGEVTHLRMAVASLNALVTVALGTKSRKYQLPGAAVNADAAGK